MKGQAVLAGLSGALSIVAGAYGVHGVTGHPAELFGTGSHYQLVHAVAAVAVLQRPLGGFASWCFVVGSLLFALPIYALALGGPHWLGALPPLGAAGMITGWLSVAIGASRTKV
ncbi:DUF423 domain-containing protein [Sphingomonas sp. CGMCC 1.13654]|uniref:DUF423 domain-containing protein n=1 Tax=Sphingomonas chungangi TaxID=2683589 RepID=A0A838L2E1_9SPHN|nr:DUF423 domain-containing protein [Sphingomonas chungangi]MBA2933227.1 DUF423 domain-containing protein [Sphingomonas chungangi]MVW57898.1 DUF423 domain-containing protein [Sphingomonas chungangi]